MQGDLICAYAVLASLSQRTTAPWMLKLLEDVPDTSDFTEGLEETDTAGPRVNHSLTSRVLTARVRSHSAKTEKSLNTLERRLEAIDEKTNDNLEKIERNLSKIKKKLEHDKDKSHKKHH